MLIEVLEARNEELAGRVAEMGERLERLLLRNSSMPRQRHRRHAHLCARIPYPRRRQPAHPEARQRDQCRYQPPRANTHGTLPLSWQVPQSPKGHVPSLPY